MQTHAFTNGLKLIYEFKESNLTAIDVLCDFGSIREPHNIKGAAHFIEHMCFKGTTHIPKPKYIFLQYDNMGAYFNALTEKQFTCYRVKCQNKYFNHCANILSDMMLNSEFGEFKTEENVVIEENIKNGDDPVFILNESVDRICYKGSAYELPIDTLAYHKSNFAFKSIFDLYKQHYQPSHFVVSVTSKLAFKSIITAINHTHFARTSSRTLSQIALQPLFQLVLQRDPQYIFTNHPIHTSHLTVAFRTCSQFSKDKYILNLLKVILGGAFSSRLFMILREENGLTYNSQVNTEYFKVAGKFEIYAECNNQKLIKNGAKKGVLPLIIDLLNNLNISQSELSLAKNVLRGKLVMAMEDIETPNIYNGSEFLYQDKIVPFSKIFEMHYKHITLGQIHQVIKLYFNPSSMIVGVVSSKIQATVIKKECERFHAKN